jgi:hypothetical protein
VNAAVGAAHHGFGFFGLKRLLLFGRFARLVFGRLPGRVLAFIVAGNKAHGHEPGQNEKNPEYQFTQFNLYAK